MMDVYRKKQMVKKVDSAEQIVHKKLIGIQNLNDDVMLAIFQFLNINDKIRLEATCFRWRYLLRLSWARFRCLDLSIQKWSNKRPKYFIKGEKLFWGQFDAVKINSVIIRSCIYLTNINLISDRTSCTVLSHYEFNCTNSCVLNMIGTNCSNLKVISTKICCVGGLQSLANYIKSLESINFIGLQNFSTVKVDELLNKLILNNCNIRSISLNKIVSLKFLENIELELREIDFICHIHFLDDFEKNLVNLIEKSKKILKKFFIKVYEIDFQKISNALKFCSNLTKLSIDVELLTNNKTNVCLNKITSQCRNIECMKIKPLNCESNIEVTRDSMNWIYHLNPEILRKLELIGNINKLKEFPVFINLQELSLDGVTSDNDTKICDSIAMCINLEKLRFSKCNLSLRTSSNNYIIKNLNNLKYLILDENKNSGLDENEIVQYVSVFLNNLEELHLGLHNLTDYGLCYLSHLNKLVRLSICKSEKFTGNNVYKAKTLKKFECFFCKNFENKFVKLLINEAYQLEKLTIFYCSKITKNIINYAIKKKSLADSTRVVLTISACIKKANASDYERKYNGLRLRLLDDDMTISLMQL